MMTQREQKWTMDTKSSNTIGRQRQLTCQLMEELEQLWEETQRERKEIDDLRTKTEQQQKNIDRLTAEKHEQNLLIKRLRLHIENVVEKLKENKNEAAHDKIQLLKMLTEIRQENETIERRRNELISERHKLEMIRSDQTKSQESKEASGAMEQIKREQEMADSLQSLINKNKTVVFEVKQAKEEMERNMADMKQELKRNKWIISQHREEIRSIKYSMNVNIKKLKQRWTEIQSAVEMQRATGLKRQSRERQKEERDTLKNKLSRIQGEMEKLWDELEQQLEETVREKQEIKTESGRMEIIESDCQMQRQDTKAKRSKDAMERLIQVQSERDENKMQTEREGTERDRQRVKAEMTAVKFVSESTEMDVMNTETEMKKQDVIKMRMSRRNQEFRMLMVETEHAEHRDIDKGQAKTEDIDMEDKLLQVDPTRALTQHKENECEEDNMDQSAKNNSDVKGVILQVEEIRAMLRRVREDNEQSRRDFTEEKSHIQWMNFRVNKKKRELDQRLERIMRESDELEIMKVKIQQHREELKQKLENTIAAILTMGEVKSNMERAAAEMNSIRNEMLKVQKEMNQNKEDVKKYMDKMTSMKAQVSKWIFTESGMKNTFDWKTSKLQEPHKEADGNHLKNQTWESLSDKREADNEMTKWAMALPPYEEIKELEHVCSEPEQEVTRFTVDMKEEQDVFIQIQTKIHEETLVTGDETKLVLHVREMEEVEKLMSKLKERVENTRQHIQSDMENMQERSQEINRIIMEINDLKSQKSETKNVFKPEIIKYEMNVIDNVHAQKQNQESVDYIQTHCEETERAAIARLREEIYRTQGIMRLMKIGVENQTESNINKYKDGDSEIERLIKDMQQFQRLLKLVKTAMRKSEMHLEEEMSNIKSMKSTTKKQQRKLDQRLEKNLRERDEVDILKIKMQRQMEAMQVTEQKLGKIAKVKNIMEKTRQKSADIMQETKVKMRQLEDLKCKIKAAKEGLENSHHLISQQRADLGKISTEIRQKMKRQSAMESTEREKGDIKTSDKAETETEQDKMTKNSISKEMEDMENEIIRLRSEKEKLEKDIKLTMASFDQKNREIEKLKEAISEREDIEMLKQQIEAERENVRIERQQTAAETHEMNRLKESIEKQKQELDDRVQMARREVRELELLKSELEIKKKEIKLIFRKNKRKSEIKWNDIQKENETLRRETIKRKRELDQRLEKNMRERDETEILMKKLQGQKKEMAEEMQRFRDQTTCIQVVREHGEGCLEKQEVKTIWEEDETLNQSSNATSSISSLQNMTQKIDVQLEMIRREMGTIENVNLHLGKQREGLKALKAKNRAVSNNMSQVKYQIKLSFGKIQIQAKTEMDEVVHMRNDIPKQKWVLETRLEEVQRERREMEVLKSELEIRKRENQQMLRKGIRKKQEVQKLWAEVEGERHALKKETQKWKEEFSQRLERINSERDELEIMKLKMQREKDKSKDGIEESRKPAPKVPNPIQQHWELIQTCIEKYKVMKKWSEDFNIAIKDAKQNMEAQAKIIIQGKEEVENMKMEIQRKKTMICALKIIQETQNEQPKESKEITMIINDTGREKGSKIPRTTTNVLQNVDETKETKEGQCDKGQNKEGQVNTEKAPANDSQDTLILKLSGPFNDMKDKAEVLKSEMQPNEEPIIAPGKEKFKTKKKLDLVLNESNNEIINQHKELSGTERVMNKHEYKSGKMDHVVHEESETLGKVRQEEEKIILNSGLLEIQGRDTSKDREKEEVEGTMNTIRGEREQLTQMKSCPDMDVKVLEIEKNRMEEERSEMKTREDQILNKIRSTESLREKLQQLNERLSEDTQNKIIHLEQKSEQVLKVFSALEQKYKPVDEQKEKLACYTEMLERQRCGLKSILSETVIQRQVMQSQQQQDAQLEKIHFIEVKTKLTDVDIESEVMNKVKLDLEMMRTDLLKQADILEQEKQDLKEERERLELMKSELQKQKENLDNQFEAIKQEKDQMQATIVSQREMLLTEMKRMEGELSELKEKEDQLIYFVKSMRNLRPKLYQLNQRQREHFSENMDRLGQKYAYLLLLNSVLQHKCDEVDKQKNKINVFYDLIQNEKKHKVMIKFDQAVQTEDVIESLQKQDVDKPYINKLECGTSALVSDVAIQTEEVELKLEGGKYDLDRKGKYLKIEREGLLIAADDEKVKNKQKHVSLSELASEQDDVTDEKLSKRDYLRKIWKDTVVERKEIDQMKCKSHEKRKSLEKRIKVINQLVQRTWLHKENEPLEKKLKQGQSKDMTSQNDCEGDRSTLNEKYTELHQLQAQMLSEIEKLSVKEKVSRIPKTSDKANQTIQVDINAEDATLLASARMNQEQMKVEPEASPETSSRLLCQLRHYCHRCCCYRCACSTQVHQVDK